MKVELPAPDQQHYYTFLHNPVNTSMDEKIKALINVGATFVCRETNNGVSIHVWFNGLPEVTIPELTDPA